MDRSIELAVNEAVKMKTLWRPNVKAAITFAHVVYVNASLENIICICGNKDADQRLCIATKAVHFLYILNPKFQASSVHLLLYSPIFVEFGRKPRRLVLS